jgi:CRP-like cAMP-binding protein
MLWVNLLGYAASATVLATFCMSTMIPLRVLGLASNVLFMAYGYLDHLTPVLLLHACLFPVNAYRLIQFHRLIQDLRDARREDVSIKSLLPYMSARTVPAGQTLVQKGENADRLYYIVQGELDVAEFEKALNSGAIVGEIGVFAPKRQRTATVICRTDCNVLELTESKAKQLYFQDRTFGFSVLQLIISRLIENNERLMHVEPDNLAAHDIIVTPARS